MKPMEKVVILAPIMFAWIIVFALMPRFPGEEITPGDWIALIATVAVMTYFIIRWLIEDTNLRNGDRNKRALERHDKRTHR